MGAASGTGTASAIGTSTTAGGDVFQGGGPGLREQLRQRRKREREREEALERRVAALLGELATEEADEQPAIAVEARQLITMASAVAPGAAAHDARVAELSAVIDRLEAFIEDEDDAAFMLLAA